MEFFLFYMLLSLRLRTCVKISYVVHHLSGVQCFCLSRSLGEEGYSELGSPYYKDFAIFFLAFQCINTISEEAA
jgi:hypothetical protein